MKIDNMREEHQEKTDQRTAGEWLPQHSRLKIRRKREPRKASRLYLRYPSGTAWDEIFRELGVDYMIEGGQTMNPSTEDMLKAIDQVNADTIFYPSEQQEYYPCSQSGAGI